MSQMDATKIRIAASIPAACSACFGQYVDRLHVDFSAAFDGPVLYGKDGSTLAAVDELVICDECMRAAAKVLGLEEPGDMVDQIESLDTRLTENSEKLAGALVYIRKLEQSLDEREKLEDVLRPKKAPPKKEKV